MKRKYEIDMVRGPILGKLMGFALPLMLSSILQLLFNAADIVVVGKFAGDNALAAVGSNTSLINLLTNVFTGLSVGSNVLTARYYGSREDGELSKTVHTSVLLSIISGIILTLVGVTAAREILILMQTPENVLDLATTYLRIYFLGMTATMVYNFGSAILRAAGDTKRPLYFLVIAGVLNVALNLLFVAVFKLSVAGVAYATIISQTLSAALVIICLIKEKGVLHLSLKKLRIDKRKFLKILQIGLPAGLQGTLFSLSNVIIQSSVNSFGEIVMAGNTAAANIEGFVYVAMNAFHQASMTFTGQNFGAGKYRRINKITVLTLASVTAVGIGLGYSALLLARPLLGIYSSSEAVISAGLTRLNIIGSTYFLCGIMDVMVGALRGVGYSVMPMIVSLIGACGLRLAWIATLFSMEQFHTTTMLYLSYPVSWIITAAVHVLCYIIIMRKLRKKHPENFLKEAPREA